MRVVREEGREEGISIGEKRGESVQEKLQKKQGILPEERPLLTVLPFPVNLQTALTEILKTVKST